jgi:protein-L-isoaspartate O-methyltransferase
MFKCHLNMGFDEWLAALEQRHLADLRIPEVTRALRALSSAYVERRHTVARGGPLDSAGKRAAFALFYAPLHFLTAAHVIRTLETALRPAPATVVDVGCGTGAAGAAWAVTAGGSPAVSGLDRHPWAVAEARWNYRTLGLKGSARQGDAVRLPRLDRNAAVIAAYVLNELPADDRVHVEDQLFAAAARGVRVLVLEPIARGVAPWWDATAARASAAGGRADEWRFAVELPPLLQTLDRAAGLNHRELTVRSIWLPGDPVQVEI